MSFNEITESDDTFKGKDGKLYNLKPLGLSDWGKFVRWVQYKPYRDALDAGLPEKKCEELFQKCSTGKVLEETSEGNFEEFDISVGSTVVQKALESIEGVEKLIELSAPHIKLDRSVVDFENYAQVHAKIIRLNFPTTEEEAKNS